MAARLGVEGRADANLCLEKLGDWAAGFGGLHGSVKLGFVCAGNGGDQVEMALGDGKTVADFLERYRRGGFELLRANSSRAELARERHGETSRVGRGEEFFRIRADAIFKARAEGILRLFQDATVG